MKSFSRTALVSTVLAGVVAFGGIVPSYGQTVDLGADMVNRYVWRGADFGESLSVQPTLEFSVEGFTVGSWGSYATNPQSANVNEHDLYANYTVETSGGTFSAGLTDYYFPSDSSYFNFESDGSGAHQVETSLSYTGPDAFPITLSGSVFVYNEPENSVYLEASYPFAVESVDLHVTAGATPAESAFYGTDKAGIVNLSLGASREVPITERFSLPIHVTYILNPYAEKTFFVFGVSL